MWIVLDTNVLIPALAFPGSELDQMLHRIRRREMDLYISPFILSELDRLLRQKFRLNKGEAEVRVNTIRSLAYLVSPAERIHVVTAKDDDNRTRECAMAAQADFLVTGDKEHLLPSGSFHDTRIVTPARLMDLL